MNHSGSGINHSGSTTLTWSDGVVDPDSGSEDPVGHKKINLKTVFMDDSNVLSHKNYGLSYYPIPYGLSYYPRPYGLSYYPRPYGLSDYPGSYGLSYHHKPYGLSD